MSVEQLENPVADAKIAAPNVRQRNTKIDSLTGLRFIAACLVFMTHVASLIPSLPYLPVFVQIFLHSGINGVALFFILSGFVLCYNYHDDFSKRFIATLKPFFVARFARIYPLNFLLFLLFFAATSFSGQLQHINVILAQLTLTQAWSSDPSVVFSYNGVSWSVSVEAFLYVCFPLLILLLFKRASKLWHLCLIGFMAFSASFLLATWFSVHGLTPIANTWLYELPVTRLGDFILGCVAARVYVLHMSKPISTREQVLGVTLLLLSITAVILLMGIGKVFLVPYKLDAGYSLFFAFIIYALARYTTPLSTFLSTKLLVLLGEASYAFYLLHTIILWYVLALPLFSSPFRGGLYIVMEFLLIVVISLGAFTYVEKPLRKRIRQAFVSRAMVVPNVKTVLEQNKTKLNCSRKSVDFPGRHRGKERILYLLHCYLESGG